MRAFFLSPPEPKDPKLLWFLYHQACNNIRQYLWCTPTQSTDNKHCQPQIPRGRVQCLCWHLCKQTVLGIAAPPSSFSSWPGWASPVVCTQLQWGSVRQSRHWLASSPHFPFAGPWTFRCLRRVVLLQWIILLLSCLWASPTWSLLVLTGRCTLDQWEIGCNNNMGWTAAMQYNW